jgi:two-component system, OmpR family, response regulator
MEGELRALIVDDEIDVCYLLSGILHSRNIQSTSVHSIAEAKKVLETEHPAVIFLDNHLPDGFGVDHIADFKRAKPNAKVAMITAYDTKTDKENADLQGVDHFIGKPFSRDDIVKVLDEILKAHRVEL